LDTLPISGCYADETIGPDVAERFATAFAESERWLVSTSESNSWSCRHVPFGASNGCTRTGDERHWRGPADCPGIAARV